MSLEVLAGRMYGPIERSLGAEKIADYVAVTGDDPERWVDVAPPSYAGALLFSVAPLLLADPDVGASAKVLVHSDQRFTWHAPLRVGETLQITGEVTRVRARGPVNFVTLEATMNGANGPVVESTSTFLMGSEPAAPPGDDHGEPVVTAGTVTDATPAWPGEPIAGSELVAMSCAASRLDLVRYAAASGDFNPIHFDHVAARNAGLDGIVVHGLLMAAWTARYVAAGSDHDAPIAEMKWRFRNALSPARIAAVTGSVNAVTEGAANVAVRLASDGEDLVTATATLRR